MSGLLLIAMLAAAQQPSGDPPAAARKEGNRMDEVICKKMPKTGSLVSTSRLCMTRREWNRSAEINQSEWGDLQGIKGSSREDQATWIGGTPP